MRSTKTTCLVRHFSSLCFKDNYIFDNKHKILRSFQITVHPLLYCTVYRKFSNLIEKISFGGRRGEEGEREYLKWLWLILFSFQSSLWQSVSREKNTAKKSETFLFFVPTAPFKGTQAWNFYINIFGRNRNHMVPSSCKTRFLKIVFDSAKILDF